MRNSANLISISTGALPKVVQKDYYDLPGVLQVMDRLWQKSVVDGFEFLLWAEWDDRWPPKEDSSKGNRLEAWVQSPRYTVESIEDLLRETGLPVLSIHAYHDIGICLCSGDPLDVERARQQMRECFSMAQKLGADVCVLHLWDTWEQAFDPGFVHGVLDEIASCYPGLKASVENIPTHLPGHTPFDLVQDCEWITLDLRWAALYDELDRFEAVKDRIANVHLSGVPADGRWVLRPAPFEFYRALGTIRDRWGYSGLFTIEAGGLRESRWEDLCAAIASLKPS